jgi:hypothetical protein
MSLLVAAYIGGAVASFVPIWYYIESVAGEGWAAAILRSLFWPLTVGVIVYDEFYAQEGK